MYMWIYLAQCSVFPVNMYLDATNIPTTITTALASMQVTTDGECLHESTPYPPSLPHVQYLSDCCSLNVNCENVNGGDMRLIVIALTLELAALVHRLKGTAMKRRNSIYIILSSDSMLSLSTDSLKQHK